MDAKWKTAVVWIAAALARFAATARDQTDLDARPAELVSVVQQTMQPDRVSVCAGVSQQSKRR